MHDALLFYQNFETNYYLCSTHYVCMTTLKTIVLRFYVSRSRIPNSKQLV
jgi:hypothetical protein